MIPLKLQLKNFLSYGPQLQTIDFTAYQLICLSGKNGHGKSALLDAITWAVWGQARKISGTAKADAHLLRLGQSQMLVVFEFEFNGQHYRIRREYATTYGKQYSSLDFGLIDSDKPISLTTKTIRDTQALIESTLGLDFEAFINSAFLRQGQSNEFSKKSPKERKDILAAILGLNNYELVRKKAVDKVKEAQLELIHLKKFQEKIEAELQKLPVLITALATLQQKLEALVQQEKSGIQQKKNLEKEKDQHAAKKNQQNLLCMSYDQKVQEKQNLQQHLMQHYREWKKVHKKLIHSAYGNDLEAQKKLLLEQRTAQQHLLQKSLELKEKILNYKQHEQNLVNTLKETHQRNVQLQQLTAMSLKTEQESKQKQLLELEKQLKNYGFELLQNQAEIERIRRENKPLKLEETDLKIQEQQFEKRKMFYHQWITQANLIKAEGNTLQQKQMFIHDELNPSCPLCEQNLSASRKKFLKSQFSKQEQFSRHRLQRLTSSIKNLKIALLEQHATLEIIKKDVEHKKIITIKIDELFKNDLKIKTHQNVTEQHILLTQQEQTDIEKKYNDESVKLQELIQQEQSLCLENKEYQAIIKHLESLQNELATINFDHKEYQKILDQIALFETQQIKADELQQEINEQHDRKQVIHESCKKIKLLKKAQQEIKLSLKNFDYLELELQKLAHKEKELFAFFSTIQEEKELLLHNKGSLENERLKLKEYEQEHSKQESKIKELTNFIFDYQAIATAVSKDGIQALIIEDALPEIEQEANDLLGQLTDNQAHIIIESLRDLKKGGTKETLDIKISDAAGIRSYELFSGGEAFRIDFALRLAISKLLARRAGTSLQTLIIDEGFGSQDEEGLSNIMDALYKIQSSFCKIIIVSHLPAMKDQFPVHFFVEKGSQGSMVRVIEQG
jgi:DNA repair protein SbcC/Rad50